VTATPRSGSRVPASWAGAALAGYVLSIYAANWAITYFGMVPVGFGLVAPAGVYFAGLSFTLRDLVQETLGRRATLFGVVAGAIFSSILSPQLALASGTAFLVSELADMGVYTPMRRRFWLLAVFASGLVGAVIDSAIFLQLAFGSLEFLPGQVVGKTLSTLAAVAVLAVYRAVLRREVRSPTP
jgi:queuosine precursor transporter